MFVAFVAVLPFRFRSLFIFCVPASRAALFNWVLKAKSEKAKQKQKNEKNEKKTITKQQKHNNNNNNSK